MIKTKADFKKTGASNGKKIAMKIISVALSVLALVATYFYLRGANNAAVDTVSIVRIKKDIPAGTAISMGDLERYAIIRKEYNAGSMILYENAENVEELISGKLAAYHLRRETPLYQDQMTEKRLPRDIILETLPEGYELTTVPYDYMEAGGNVLLPGDLICMRVSYEVEAIPQDENGNDYSYKISAGNGSFLITILGRNGNDIDFDAFTTIETEVRLWLDGGITGN